MRRLVGPSGVTRLVGSFLVAQSAPVTYEIMKKSWWEKKPNGNLFIDILALLKGKISVRGGGQFLRLERQGEMLLIAFFRLIFCGETGVTCALLKL